MRGGRGLESLPRGWLCDGHVPASEPSDDLQAESDDDAPLSMLMGKQIAPLDQQSPLALTNISSGSLFFSDNFQQFRIAGLPRW